MSKYIVEGFVSINIFKEIEAKSAKEASDLAGYLTVPELCYLCNKSSTKEEWEFNGFDDVDFKNIDPPIEVE